MSEQLSEAETAANAADASDAAADASGAVVEASDAPAEASNTADALAVVLESNLPTFVAGHTKIVGALRRCDKSWRDALGAHPATKRLFARCAACGKFAWRCSDCQGVAQPGEERRRGPPRDEVLCLDCRHVDIEKSYGRTESSPWGGQLHIPAIHGPRPDRAPRPCIDCGTLVCLACCVKRDFDPWSTTRDMDEETARAIIMSSDPQKEINKRLTPAARCGHCYSHVPRPENKKKNRCFTAGSMLSFGDGDADGPPADY